MASPPTLWMEMESGGAENRMRWRKIGENMGIGQAKMKMG